MTTLPLTDDQLRHVAANMAVDYGREQADDVMGIGEMLDHRAEDLGVTLDLDTIPDDVFDTMTGRIADLIRAATITVDWADSDVCLTSSPDPDRDPNEPEAHA